MEHPYACPLLVFIFVLVAFQIGRCPVRIDLHFHMHILSGHVFSSNLLFHCPQLSLWDPLATSRVFQPHLSILGVAGVAVTIKTPKIWFFATFHFYSWHLAFER